MIDRRNKTEYEERLKEFVKTKDIETGNTVYMPGIELYNAHGDTDQQQNWEHSFRWELMEYTEIEWTFKLYFNKPTIISMEIPADFLEIKFWNQELFQAKNGRYVKE